MKAVYDRLFGVMIKAGGTNYVLNLEDAKMLQLELSETITRMYRDGWDKCQHRWRLHDGAGGYQCVECGKWMNGEV